MSQKANYFKLGLFVIGAIMAGIAVLLVIGSGRWFERKITIETTFNESVQGLDIGSKIKFKGVVIGEVTRITFTYVVYQQDLPMSQRARYVLVESQIQPRLVGGRAAAGDLTDPANAKMEVERGLRIRLTPQGITGTSFLELDYVEPPPAVLPLAWTPNNIYIPSAPSTVAQFVNAASDILERIQKLDIENTLANINKLLTTTNERISAIDTGALSSRASKAFASVDTTLARVDSTIAALDLKKLNDEAISLVGELRQTNAELKKTLANPAWAKIPEDASAAANKVKDLVSDPKLAQTIQRLERSLGRVDRLLGGGEQDLASTISNLRQITDNLRDLTEDAKRYPSNLLFGEPPRPLPQGQP